VADGPRRHHSLLPTQPREIPITNHRASRIPGMRNVKRPFRLEGFWDDAKSSSHVSTRSANWKRALARWRRLTWLMIGRRISYPAEPLNTEWYRKANEDHVDNSFSRDRAKLTLLRIQCGLRSARPVERTVPLSPARRLGFASRHSHGKQPYWGQAILHKYLRPAARELGVETRFGWHTFRHTYSTLLRSVGTKSG
jgi:hypothetical protein